MIKRNALSNLVGRIWGIISLFIFIPFYISYLGSTGYGYIGFYNTLVALLAFADLGFSAATTREFARLSGGDEQNEIEKSKILRSYEFLYLSIVIIVVLTISFGANWISHKWLVASTNVDVSQLIILMALSFGLQLPTNLYVGALMGSERQILANGLQIGWGIFRSAGVLPILHYISNSLEAFFIWQFLSNFLFLIIIYKLTCRKIKSSDKKFSLNILKSTYRYALGMAGMGILASVATQIDKLIVTKNFNIEVVGFYTLAGTLSLIPLIFITTLAKAAFPRFTILKEKQEIEHLKTLYFSLSKIAVVAILPISTLLAIYSHSIIYMWTHSLIIADKASDIVFFLMLAQAIQALTVLPFYLSLSYAYVRINMIFSAIMIIEIPIVYYFAMQHEGTVGVAKSVLITVLTIFIPYMYLLHTRLISGIFSRWCSEVSISVFLCVIAIYILDRLGVNDRDNLLFTVINGLVTWLILSIIILFGVGIKKPSHMFALLKSLR